MITLSSSQHILIIFQVSHDELLERKVNAVNPITIKRKAFVRRLATVIIRPFLVLMEREQLSFKTLFTYP